MTESSAPLIDALNDCIDRLNAGESITSCLRDYPQHAVLLEPLLERGLAVRAAHPAVPLGAQARVRARVMQAADRLDHAQHRPAARAVWGWRVDQWVRAAALLALVIGAAVLVTWLRGKPDERSLHMVPLTEVSVTVSATTTTTATVSSTVSATATVSVTPSPSATATATPTVTVSASATLSATAIKAGSPTPAARCTLTVISPSINLRAGPGQGYAVSAVAYAGDTLQATAIHTGREWYAIRVNTSTLWVSTSVVTPEAACATLPVSDLPLRAGTPTITPESGPPGVNPLQGGSGAATPDDSDDDHEEDDSSDDSNDDHSGRGSDDREDDSLDDHSGSDDSSDDNSGSD